MKRDGKPVLDVHAFRGLLWKFLGDDWPLEQKRELFNVFNDALLEYQWKRKPDIIFRSQRLSGRVVDLWRCEELPDSGAAPQPPWHLPNAQNPPIKMSGESGLVSRATLAGSGLTGPLVGNNVWRYSSSDSSTAISGVAGYFTGQGFGGRTGPNSTSPPPVGMRLGDLVIHTETSAGATPGKATLMSVTGSTADQASTLSSSGYNNAKYDVTAQ